jgi:DNA-binding response OmpR family regulator
VVDDDPAVQRLLERMLRRHGFTPLHAASMAEAINATESTAIDAVILDLGLKGAGSGEDVLRWLRHQTAYAHTPVLILTGRALSTEDVDGLHYYGAEVLMKPQPTQRIIEFLKAALSR